MMSKRLILFTMPLVFCLASGQATADDTSQATATARQGMVVTVSPDASDVGLEVLRRGGNAVDAAVAVALALAVTYPAAGNIGGGGFMMIRPNATDPPVCVEYRETAPAATSETTFADSTDQRGHRTVGVPGTLRGLELAHSRYGSLKWEELVAPAVRLARNGFVVDRALAGDLNQTLDKSKEFDEFQRVFSHSGGGPWRAGDRFIQPELAQTLEVVSRQGADAFYRGAIATQIVTEMKNGGGLISAEDLAGYQAHVREPVHGTYRGFDVYGTPPPSSGGTMIVQSLNILETFDLKSLGRWSPETLHLMIESLRRAFCDRAKYLGDPAYTKIPPQLTTKEYARQLAAGIDPARATPSASLASEIPLADEGTQTTHFSIVDSQGMAVANTYTLQDAWGSRVVVRGAGFLLNNEMTDFNWRPGHTDRKGMIGTKANLIAPGKRMLSSQSPTIVLREGKLVLVTGSPGGRTIPSTVVCMLINVLDFSMDARQAVDAPRLHHGWFPDRVLAEPSALEPWAAALSELRRMGHTLTTREASQGDAHSILLHDDQLHGAADLRETVGKAAGY